MGDSDRTGTPFQVVGAEGEAIRGNVHLPAQCPLGRLPVVLMFHGFKGYKDYGFFPHLTQRLADRVPAVAVRFNFSHSGIDDDPSTFGRPDLFERDAWSKQLADVRALLAVMEAGGVPHTGRMNAARIGLVGHSRGGVVALLSGGDPRVRAVVALSAPSTSNTLTKRQKDEIRERGFCVSPSSRTGQDLRIGRAWLEDLEQNADRLNVKDAVARMRAPLMVVHGSADESVPACCAEDIAAWYAGRGETLLIAGADHTFNCRNPFEGSSAELERLIEGASAFLKNHLGAEV